MNGHLRVVEFLINQKADINLKDKNGKTPLGLSIDGHKSSITEFIRSQGGK